MRFTTRKAGTLLWTTQGLLAASPASFAFVQA